VHALHTYLFHPTLMACSEHAYGLRLDPALVCLHKLAHNLYLRQALTGTPYSTCSFTDGKL